MKSKKGLFLLVAGIVIAVILIFGINITKEKTEDDAPDAEFVKIDRVDAPYEHWLAAAVMTSISMDYPDFQLDKIYVSDETSVEDRMNSNGIYVTFFSEGELKCIFSKPIEKLRDTEGSFDIFAEYLGYATYDEMKESDIETATYKMMEINEIGKLIEQLDRVTKFMN